MCFLCLHILKKVKACQGTRKVLVEEWTTDDVFTFSWNMDGLSSSNTGTSTVNYANLFLNLKMDLSYIVNKI